MLSRDLGRRGVLHENVPCKKGLIAMPVGGFETVQRLWSFSSPSRFLPRPHFAGISADTIVQVPEHRVLIAFRIGLFAVNPCKSTRWRATQV